MEKLYFYIMKDLLRPNVFKVIVAVMISGLLLMALIVLNTPCVPCMKKPIVNPKLNATYSPSMCSLASPLIVGVSIQYYWLSYISIITLFFIIPYLCACAVEHFFIKKKQ